MKLAHHRPRPVRRRPGQPGAALVELAFVALLLCVLSAGSWDYGMTYRVGLATNEAARTGARTGSALGATPLADYYALTGAKAALASSGVLNQVERVVIYKSATADGQPPAACLTTTSTTEKCNMLTGVQFRSMAQSGFDTVTGCYTSAQIKNWCPKDRDNVQLTAEYYGIWISTRYTNQFKMISTGTLVTRDAVMRLEPTVSS